MQFLIDSTDPKEIQTACSWGIIDGVTTNLSLVAKGGPDMQATIEKVLEVSPGVVYAQVVGWKEVEPIKAQARWLHKFSDRLMVKIPMSMAGLQAVTELKREDPQIPLAVTAVSSVAQAFMVAKVGADVCALFNGPLDLEQDEPVNLVAPVRDIYDRHGYQTKILSAGRFPRAFGGYVADGSDICTMRFEFLKVLGDHAFTDKRMNGFLNDWKNVFGDKTWPSA